MFGEIWDPWDSQVFTKVHMVIGLSLSIHCFIHLRGWQRDKKQDMKKKSSNGKGVEIFSKAIRYQDESSQYRLTWIWRTTVRRIFAYDGRSACSQSDAYQVFVLCVRRILHMTDQFSWSHWVCHIQVHLYLFALLNIGSLIHGQINGRVKICEGRLFQSRGSALGWKIGHTLIPIPSMHHRDDPWADKQKGENVKRGGFSQEGVTIHASWISSLNQS